MLLEAGAVVRRRLAWSLAGLVLLGPAFGLSLFLLLRASRAIGRRQALGQVAADLPSTRQESHRAARDPAG